MLWEGRGGCRLSAPLSASLDTQDTPWPHTAPVGQLPSPCPRQVCSRTADGHSVQKHSVLSCGSKNLCSPLPNLNCCSAGHDHSIPARLLQTSLFPPGCWGFGFGYHIQCRHGLRRVCSTYLALLYKMISEQNDHLILHKYFK